MATRIITIGNQQIEAEEKEMPQAELFFYSENPRIYTILQDLGDNPSQQDIEKHMIAQDHVKHLKESIKANGGLLEPIIVRRNVVLEGNSRLAAYRLLARENLIKWGMIKCNVLADDTTDDVVTALLGTLHLVGKTPWSPYEQAGFLVRRIEKSRKPIDAIAQELGISTSDAKFSIQVYNEMLAADDMKPTKWSYYFELLKNREIRKYDENNPVMHFKETLIEKIKNDEIERAADIRKYATVVKAKGENVEEAITDVLNGEITIDQAVDLVSAGTKLASLNAKVDAFLKYVKKEQTAIKENRGDVELNFSLKQIQQLIKIMLG